MHQQRDQGDDEHHHHGETVDLDAGGEAHAAVLEPREVVQHGKHLRLAALRAEVTDAATERAERGAALGVLDALDPLHERAAREHERRRRPTTIPTSEPCRGMRLPNSRITTNESAGISGISHALSRKNIEPGP